MARISSESRTPSATYAAHRAEAHAHSEHADCAVRAVAAATERAYAEVHAMFGAAGRKHGRPTPTSITWAVLKQLGFRGQLVPASEMISQYPRAHQVLRGLTSHHPERFNGVWRNGKTYLMFTPRHVLAIRNGTNLDWSKGRALRATHLYQIVPV